MGNITYIVFWR